jgi:chemotaxis protein CheX
MSESITTHKPYGTHEFLSADNRDRADEAVVEVFSMMLGFEIGPAPDSEAGAPEAETTERTAIVGFSGSMRGTCEVRMTCSAARSVASAMLGGAPIEEDDDSIDDAIGELCNMLAGGWKNRIPTLTADCSLSPPTVISGGDYKVHTRQPSVKLSRIYRFEAHALHLTLHREDLVTA